MSKSLADELNTLAGKVEWLMGQLAMANMGYESQYACDLAAEVRAMAERVQGRVVVQPRCLTNTWMKPDKFLAHFSDTTKHIYAYGDDEAGAIAALQSLLDQQK